MSPRVSVHGDPGSVLFPRHLADESRAPCFRRIEQHTMSPRVAKTPQIKKAESLANDRRNSYGDNSKSSRKNIRRRKRFVNQSNRHAEQVQERLAITSGTPEEAAEAMQSRRRKRWRKCRDVPLGVRLLWQKEARRARAGRKTGQSWTE